MKDIKVNIKKEYEKVNGSVHPIVAITIPNDMLIEAGSIIYLDSRKPNKIRVYKKPKPDFEPYWNLDN